MSIGQIQNQRAFFNAPSISRTAPLKSKPEKAPSANQQILDLVEDKASFKFNSSQGSQSPTASLLLNLKNKSVAIDVGMLNKENLLNAFEQAVGQLKSHVIQQTNQDVLPDVSQVLQSSDIKELKGSLIVESGEGSSLIDITPVAQQKFLEAFDRAFQQVNPAIIHQAENLLKPLFSQILTTTPILDLVPPSLLSMEIGEKKLGVTGLMQNFQKSFQLVPPLQLQALSKTFSPILDMVVKNTGLMQRLIPPNLNQSFELVGNLVKAENGNQMVGVLQSASLFPVTFDSLVEEFFEHIDKVLKGSEEHNELREKLADKVQKALDELEKLMRGLDLSPIPDTPSVMGLIDEFTRIIKETQEEMNKIYLSLSRVKKFTDLVSNQFLDKDFGNMRFHKDKINQLFEGHLDDMSRLRGAFKVSGQAVLDRGQAIDQLLKDALNYPS